MPAAARGIGLKAPAASHFIYAWPENLHSRGTVELQFEPGNAKPPVEYSMGGSRYEVLETGTVMSRTICLT